MTEPRRPSRKVRQRRALVLIGGLGVFLTATISAALIFTTPSPSAEVAQPAPLTRMPTQTPTSTPAQTFDTTAHSIDDASSIWVVVNKQRALNPQDYEPDLIQVPVPYSYELYLRPEASDAVVQMFTAFTAETGGEMQSQSAYRSYSTQQTVYARWVSTLGQEDADLTSARPGHSEHQTGLTIDLNALPDQGCQFEPCWGSTPHAQWLAANSWRFGFIVRYPDGMTDITGYEYEPYHMRFVGIELATEMHTTGISTLEEFFGLPAAPHYG